MLVYFYYLLIQACKVSCIVCESPTLTLLLRQKFAVSRITVNALYTPVNYKSHAFIAQITHL